MKRRMLIGIVGGRDVSPEILSIAEEVGGLIAERGAVLVCGGLGGVMEAACRGANNAGGMTVGILPGGDPHAANPFVELVIPTDLGVARNSVIINACSGIVAVGGKFGTLSEVAFALQKGIPVVSLKSWDVSPEIIQAETAGEAVKQLFQRIPSD